MLLIIFAFVNIRFSVAYKGIISGVFPAPKWQFFGVECRWLWCVCSLVGLWSSALVGVRIVGERISVFEQDRGGGVLHILWCSINSSRSGVRGVKSCIFASVQETWRRRFYSITNE